MNQRDRIYLDHAATSWPKAPSVIDAMNRFVNQCGAAAGRGSYRSSGMAGEVLSHARLAIAEMIHAESPKCISFHSGGTGALNAAVHGLLQPGQHVVTTAAEHNSVLRPLHFLQRARHIDLTIVPVDLAGVVGVGKLMEAVTDGTSMVAVTGASNVTGAVQPIAEIGQQLAERDCVFLCDAAQTVGVVPIDVQANAIDVLAAPGHKGIGGPAGTGFLYVREELNDRIIPTILGGTGSISESLEMPTSMPDKLEAGSPNTPAIAGLLHAVQLLGDVDTDRTHECCSLSTQLHDGLSSIDGVKVFGEPSCISIASIEIDGVSASDAAMILDAEYGIEVRSGKHCAALVHDCIGSSSEGTLRISGGKTTSLEDIEKLVSAVRQIAQSMPMHNTSRNHGP